ncbi:MAG TPA: signal peptidase I [Candidatus Scatovivens faecipullorum]|nr:signal peptidase I [Candidatus Scatovivens faecipullorum]
MKEKLKNIDFVAIILIIILVILLFCYSQIKIFGKKYINFCGYTIFQVITGSMADTIQIKDIVIVKLTQDVEVNDIITYKSGEDFVTHRVIKIEDNKITTKGDANNSEDNPITKDEVVGKVVFIISNVAVWMNVFRTPEVLLAIIFTIIMIKILFFRKK